MLKHNTSNADKGFVSLPRQKRLSTMAAEQLAQMIADNHLPIGDRLPPERQLAAALGVSRTVLREATKVLEARGLVQADPGGGVVVRGLSPAPVTDIVNLLLNSDSHDTTFEDVLEVRRLLEVGTAVLSAQNSTSVDITKVRLALQAMIAAQDPDDQMRADFAFHLAIAEASHNKVLVFLMRALNEVIVQGWRQYWQARSRHHPPNGDPMAALELESNQYHVQLLDAIQMRKPEDAGGTMTKLLVHWAEMYGRALEEQ